MKIIKWARQSSSSHLLMYILIWFQSLSYYTQLIDEYWTVGWALPSSYAPSSPDRLELDGWSTMWAGLDEAVPGWVWENNPGRHMDLLLRDMGRETSTIVLHAHCLGKEGVQACCKGFHGCEFDRAREETTDAAILLLLIIATCQVGLRWKCWDMMKMKRYTSWKHHKLRCIYTLNQWSSN